MPDLGAVESGKKLTPQELDLLTLSQLLGYPHPDYLLQDLTARQLDDWIAWLKRFYPFPDRLDPYFASLIATTHNVWCDSSDAIDPRDLMLYHDRFDEDLTAEDLRRKLGLKG